MELNEAINAFSVRLYQWALRDFSRELEAGCPLLSLIARHNRNVGAFVSWNRALPPTDRRHLARAMTLMYHNNARNVLEERITEEMERWGEEFYEQTTVRMEGLPPLLSADRDSPSFRPPSIDLVFGALAPNLSPAFGRAKRHPTVISCRRTAHDWNIVTDFRYAERENNLTFEYQFIRKDGTPVLEAGYGPFPRNLLAFYGIWPHTAVGVPSRADCEPIARAVARLAEHFVSQADQLFVGLGTED